MIDLDRVSKQYEKGQPAVDEISLHVDKGEFVFVVGESGAGKSTLIKLLMKELEPTHGIITVNGYVLNTMKHRQIPKYRRQIGVVYQDFRLLPEMTVYENVAFAQHVIEAPAREIRKRVPEALREVGLAEKYKSLPRQLSGGEQQRVAIARAVVNRPKILLADEPTGNLDPRNSLEIMKLLEESESSRCTEALSPTTSRKEVTLKLSSFGYHVKQGFKNIGRNKMFSIASIATMTACIFIFGAFFSIIMNVNAIRTDLEQRVGVTVFMNEGVTDDQMTQIGDQIKAIDHVTSVTFTSADEAWSQYQEEYFESNPALAEGFSDNPLANSANFTVLVDKIENQDAVVSQIKAIDGVRQVNQSSGAATTLKSFNRLFTMLSVAIIAVLLVVSVILISNTINVGIEVRKDEIGIMKLIGATDSFVRAPFVVEGLILGLIGSVIPMVILYFGYNALMTKVLTKFGFLSSMSGVLLSVKQVFVYVGPVSLILGLGIGLTGAIITVKKHLQV